MVAMAKENNVVVARLEEDINIWKEKLEDLEKEKQVLQNENNNFQQELGGLEKDNVDVLDIRHKGGEE